MREVKIKFDFEEAHQKLDTKLFQTRDQLAAVDSRRNTELLQKQVELQQVSLQLQRENEFRKWQIQYGDTGANMRWLATGGQELADGFAKALTGTRGAMATALGAVGVGASFSGLAQSAGDVTSEVFFTSFQLLSTEIALTTLPAIVEFSMYVQEGARYIRDMSDGAKSTLGNLVTFSLTFVGIGLVGQQVISTFANLVIVSQQYAGTMTGKLMSGATKVAGAFALVGTAAMALQYALSYSANQVNSLQNQINQIQSTGQISFEQLQQLPPLVQQQLQQAETPEQVQQIAAEALANTQAQSASAQEQSNQNAQGWQSWMPFAQAFSSNNLFASPGSNPGFSALMSGLEMFGLGTVQTLNNQIQGSQLPTTQNEMQQSVLQSLLQNGGILPQQLTPQQRAAAQQMRFLYGAGGFQSQQMDVASIHDTVQREAVKDPLQQAREEQMERARRIFIETFPQIGMTMQQLAQVANTLNLS